MSEPDWRVRVGRDGDRELLASFGCSNSTVPYQAEVEQFVQEQLLDWTLTPGATGDDPRLLFLVVTATSELVGVAAHERVILQGSHGVPFNATRLEVIAVTTEWQGKTFESSVRVSDVLMSAVMYDVSRRVPSRDARVFATVHEENERSQKLLRRYGLTEMMSSSTPGYLRLVTPGE